jgi:hypothetical protein
MRELAKEYPDDLDAQVLFAESLMNTMPWDYWTRDRTPKPETEEILAALRFVMARYPNHPGANHFYIHAVEAGPNPEHGLPAADRLAGYAPAAGHLVHMPAHIYVRVGQYHDAVLANERALKADRDYIRQCRALGFYPGAYYPHNMYFLWWARLFSCSKDALRTPPRATRGWKLRGRARRWKRRACATCRLTLGRWDEVLPSRSLEHSDPRTARSGLAFAAKRISPPPSEQLALSHRGERERKTQRPAFPVADTLAIAYWLQAKRRREGRHAWHD